ncbi:PREDICTED: uncharacterized protein LOC109160889 [Ipomoea nil]|uniref:uncharacterized protein LOC109160889 n=1 Tax=Ipomoea nil TaxID=35883 RepID=UPI0009008A3D|nr:PREDICTED: uncharacterized protein LOC109160889 [Ipomoea nil]
MAIGLDTAIEDVASRAVSELVQFVAKHMDLVVGIDSEIIDLTSDIETFNARLVDASKTPRANDLQVMKVIVKKFRFVVDEAKDAIDKYFAEKKNHEDKTFTKCFDKLPHYWSVNAFASEIQSIRAKVNAIIQNHERDLLFIMQCPNSGQNNHQFRFQTRPVLEKVEVVGFDGDLKTIKAVIIEASDKFNVIPIVGMAGTGKTTFAAKLFDDLDIKSKFALCVWVHVSQGFDRKQKLIDILHQIKNCTDDYSTKSGDRLRDEIKKLLNDQKYFVVLDDVWEREDWKSLNEAFPKNSKGSRVLVTTRSMVVIDSQEWKHHTLTKLTPDDSWDLLKENVFGKEGCDTRLFKEYGKEIANKCNGLPLAIRVIAGILSNSRSIADWERIAKNPFLEINREDQSYHELIMLSYEHLPNEKLKNCFLYFASFPMGYVIAVWKLIRLWIVEEFIPTIDEWGYPLDMEVEAQKYLNVLMDRNLVIVMKRRVNGQIKTCRIHDALHEFCKSEAAKKNLFRVMDDGQRLDANTVSSRRLCFYSPTVSTNRFGAKSSNNPSSSFLSCYNKKRGTCPSGERVYTLLLSSIQKDEIQLEGETESVLPYNKTTHLFTKGKFFRRRDSYTQVRQNLLTAIWPIPNTFPLLRVLDIESLKLKSVPDELYDLNLLRYLAITVDIDLLPKQFRRLRDLETLVFRTTKHTLQIEGGIWNMKKLRHVHTNTSTQLPSPPKNYSLENLDIRTLCSISPACCKEEIISKTTKLQTLNISGNLEELLEEKQPGTSLFKNLQMLDCLENLKLHGLSNKELTMPHDKFPLKIRNLTLSNTLFKWDDMSKLTSLDKLEMLKLEENCCKGERWDLNREVVFKQLQYLRIGRTNLVTWKVVEKNFPALERLVLRNCTALQEIPAAFAKVYSLKVMELFRVSNSAAKSAKELHDRLLSENKEVKSSTGSNSKHSDQLQSHENEEVKSNTGSNPKLPDQLQSHDNEKVKSTMVSDPPPDQLQSHENEKVKSRRVFNLVINSVSSQIAAAGADIVGFDDEVKIVKDRLRGGSKNLIIISIVGLLGLGKTTLATMLFNDYELQCEFFTRIQLDIPEAFNVKKVFIDILRELTDKVDKYNTMPEEKLACKIKEFLEGQKYFIVIDNIRTTEEWDSLKPAFPDNIRGSRILVTTRHYEVGFCVDSACNPHRLKFLTDEKSLQLLEKNVLQGTLKDSDKEKCSKLFKVHGRNISTKCKGIPSVVKLIANVLKKKETSEVEWEQIAEDPWAIFGHLDENYNNPLAQFIFDEMDLELKDCFLYLAAFPEGHEITAWKLIWLWIAEGLFLVEDEKYLNNLVDMNLLKVMKRRADGQIKTCCIGPRLHQLCKIDAANKNPDAANKNPDAANKNPDAAANKNPDAANKNPDAAANKNPDAANENPDAANKNPDAAANKNPDAANENPDAGNKNPVHEKDGSESSDKPAEVNKIDCRRICIKSSVLNFIQSEMKSASKHVDSFLCFCSEEISNIELLATIPKSFPALRVVDIESLKLKSLPEELYHLYHLRYLAVSTDGMQRLPQDFNKFENMQTLVFNTSQSQGDSLEVEADIWSLTKLRHVRTNTCMQLPLPSSNTGSTGIRALSFISPSSCTAEILGKTPYLQKLGIRGNIVELIHMAESKEGRNSPLFENLGKLSRLDNLKLLNNGGRPGELQSVPQHVMFPQSLRKLTLSNMWLEWKDMRILGALNKLEVLKLKEHAFMGEYWELNTVFKQLRFLMIGRTDLVVWKTSASCFPKLEKLILKDCTHLSEIPPNFAVIPNFKQMELYGTNEGAANSAEKIQEEQYKQGTYQFKLLIGPPHNPEEACSSSTSSVVLLSEIKRSN